jgi:hypothetical protein
MFIGIQFLQLTARRYNCVSVTRRSIRAGSCHPRQRDQKTVKVRGEYGAVFAIRVQTLWTIRVSRYKVDRRQVTSQGTQSFIAGTGAIAV